MVVLVTGGNGQIGQALKSVADLYTNINFVFCSTEELNITNKEQCFSVIQTIKPDFLINLAAYTAVDLAEDELEKAYEINAIGVKNIAEVCSENQCVLIHISTDFIFDGTKEQPYLETDTPNPLGVYGASKLKGEEYIKALLLGHYIIRTSWVYSDFGHNFKKTMLRLAESRKEINVVNDQIGCPTNAVDLVHFILKIVERKPPYGIYNFCGQTSCSWYDLAKLIFDQAGIEVKVNPISTKEFPAKAKRPKYSVLDINKALKFLDLKN